MRQIDRQYEDSINKDLANCLEEKPKEFTKSKFQNGIKYSINVNLPSVLNTTLERKSIFDENGALPQTLFKSINISTEETKIKYQALPQPITKHMSGPQQFSLAKQKLCLNNLRQTSTGFHLDCPKLKYNIQSLLERFDLTGETKSELHTAEGDCLALQKIIQKYNYDFFTYVQYNAQIFYLE